MVEAEPVIHHLKVEKQWADAKLAGDKPFEIRFDDRGFQRGHLVRYVVVDPNTHQPWRSPGGAAHPLERCTFTITYVQRGVGGLEAGWCVFADMPRRAGQ